MYTQINKIHQKHKVFILAISDYQFLIINFSVQPKTTNTFKHVSFSLSAYILFILSKSCFRKVKKKTESCDTDVNNMNTPVTLRGRRRRRELHHLISAVSHSGMMIYSPESCVRFFTSTHKHIC